MTELPPWKSPDASTDNERLKAALQYAEAGLRVFPVHGLKNGICTCGDPRCERPAKHPLTAHGFHEATTDSATIGAWWHRWPLAGPAIIASDIGCVLDVDPRNGGDSSFDALTSSVGSLPDTVEVQTGGGGWHYWFRLPEGVTLRKGKLGDAYPGIDVQASNSYVIAPPAMHASGRAYEFEGSSDFLEGHAVEIAPDWLIQACQDRAPRPGAQAGGPQPDATPAPPGELERIEAALSVIDASDYGVWIEIGQALHSTCWVEAFELWDTWSQSSDKYPGDAALRRRWASFNAHGAISLSTVYYHAKQAPQVAALVALAPALGFMVGADFDAAYTPPKFLIQKWVPDQSLGVLFGDPGSYKTFQALDWALHLAAGRNWAEHKTQSAGVAVIANEGHIGLHARVKAWATWHNVKMADLPFAITKAEVPLLEDGGAEVFAEAVRTLPFKPRLFIVDTLAGSFAGGNENAQDDMTRFIANVRRHLMLPFKAGALLIHHTGHQDKERARGSSVLNGAVDYSYRMSRIQATELSELACTKMKDAERPREIHVEAEELVLGEHDGEPYGSLVLKPGATYEAPQINIKSGAQQRYLGVIERMQKETRERLDNLGKTDEAAWVSRRQLAAELGEEADALRQQLKRLKDAGLIELTRHDVRMNQPLTA